MKLTFKEKNPWYDSWRDARRRCEDPRVKGYTSYASRGIKFLLSKDDMKFMWERDKAHLMVTPSLDREDGSGNYELSNCRFMELKQNLCRPKAPRRKKEVYNKI